MKNLIVKNINWILTGIIVIALAGLGYLGISYMNEESDQDRIADKIDDKKIELAEQEAGQEDENALLVEAQAKLDKATEGFPIDLDSTDVIALILDFQEETNVDIMPLSVQPAASIEIGGQSYTTVSFTATVQGTLQNILDFIEKMESGPISTFAVSGVSLAGSGPNWSTSIRVTVLSQNPTDPITAAISD